MGDLEVAYDSDQEVSKDHSKLIQAVTQLDRKQRVNKAERSEPVLEVSEFHLVKSGITNKDTVHVQDLVKSLGQKGYQNEITKKIRSDQQRNKTLQKPLEKPSAEKIQRKSGFERTLRDLSKWNAIVAKNRSSTHLSFPLKYPRKKMKKKSTTDFLNEFRFKSELQLKLEALDAEAEAKKLKHKLPPPTEEKDEEKDEKTNKPQITLREMKVARNEAARLRAQQSYKEAKAQRERKIKSKKFHRIERKKKIKQQLKEFEELQKTNPEKALEKLEQLDKTRAEERMSLRHKNTGQWAKNKQIRAKYDKETRQVLAEQLSISRELTQKIKPADNDDDDDDDDDDDKNEVPLVLSNNVKNNLWANKAKTKSEVDEFVEIFRKFNDEKKKRAEEVAAAEIDNKPKPSANKRKLDDELEEQIPDESNKTDEKITAAAVFTNQEIKESIESKKPKKKRKKAESNSTVSLGDIESEKEKVKLRNEKTEAKTKRNKSDEKQQCNKKTGSKASKTANLDDVFESAMKNIKHEIEVRAEKIREEIKMESKVNKKRKKEEKDKKNEDYMPDLEFKNPKQKPILDVPLEESTFKEISQQDTDPVNLKKTITNTEQKSTKVQTTEINLQKYANTEPKYLMTQLPDLDADGEDVLDDDEQEVQTQGKLMNDALADDDALEEFRKEKEEEIKNSQPQNINLSLPGWGSWAGTNIKASKDRRKNKLFILKFPKDAPRKDENKGDVIIFEGENKKLKQHLVNELPYPFTTVQDFEASMRAPIGRTFVPEKAHRRLIQPSVVTKSGKVIEPMTKDMLVQKQPVVKRHIDKQKKNRKNKKEKQK